MIGIARHKYSLIVLYAVCLHYIWMVGLTIDQGAIRATALSVFNTLLGIPIWAMPALFCFVATLALSALLMNSINALSIAMMLPQQFMLTISAYGAIHAIWAGQFGDGVLRSHSFILVDQAPSVLAALAHTLAIIGMGQRWNH